MKTVLELTLSVIAQKQSCGVRRADSVEVVLKISLLVIAQKQYSDVLRAYSLNVLSKRACDNAATVM